MSSELTDFEYLRDNPSAFVDEVIGIEPFDYQREFMDSDAKRKVFVAGRQVGKSRTASWIALHYAVTHPDSLVLVTADALRQSSELFAQLQSEINNAGLSDDAWGIERSTQTEVEFDHGSRIKVVPTGRNGNKIRGFTADMIIADEAAFIEDKIFEEVIEPMTFVSDGTIVLCSTPYGASGYFYEKSEKARLYEEAGDPDEVDGEYWYRTHASSYDNPKIDEDDIEGFKEGKTQKQIKQEVLGEFIPTGDQFFTNSLIRQCRDDEIERSPGSKVYCGVDLGASGVDQTVFALIDETGDIFSVETHDFGLVESRKRLMQLDNFYDFEQINVDRGGVGEGFIAELRHAIGNKVEDVYLSTQKKQSVYQTLKAHMESGDIRFPPDKDIRLQLEKLGFKKTKTGNLSIHAKQGFHDDIPDAMALAVWALPNTGGSGSMGAQGMTEMVTIGRLEGSGSDRHYKFGSDESDGAKGHDEDLNQAFVGSNRIHYD
jgi:phage FluMu gp28-like protein